MTYSCQFREPFSATKCNKTPVEQEEGEYKGLTLFCKEHTHIKCSVCGRNAFLRCEAVCGVVCGVPLCDLCGQGRMCLQHATKGPLFVIRALLGGGPLLSLFSTPQSLDNQVKQLKEVQEYVKKAAIGLTMQEFVRDILPEIQEQAAVEKELR